MTTMWKTQQNEENEIMKIHLRRFSKNEIFHLFTNSTVLYLIIISHVLTADKPFKEGFLVSHDCIQNKLDLSTILVSIMFAPPTDRENRLKSWCWTRIYTYIAYKPIWLYPSLLYIHSVVNLLRTFKYGLYFTIGKYQFMLIKNIYVYSLTYMPPTPYNQLTFGT